MGWIKELRETLQGEVYDGAVHRSLYSTDASIYQIQPQAVVLPRDAEDVVRTVKIAARHRIPLAARGGGSGLAGESLCRGIIIDFPAQMNRVLALDTEKGRVTVQPGLVFEDLNRLLAGTPWIFGPNPASGNRCTLGGMIANNSTGAYSLKYGFTADYIEELEVVLADGSLVTLGPQSPEEARQVPLLGKTVDLIINSQELIGRHTPRIKRNTAGYLLRDVWKNGTVDLTRLLCGSECTLGVVVSAALRLSPRPRYKGMLVMQFADLLEAYRTVPRALQCRPMAVEIMDRMLLDFANEASPDFRRLVDRESQAIVMVEVDGDTPEQVREKINACRGHCAGQFTSSFPALDQATMDLVWNLRKAGVPLLDRHGGDRRPTHFIEDAAVPPAALAEFVARTREVFTRYNTSASFFAHAGDGVLHLSPFLNLKDPADLANLPRLAKNFYAIVRSLQGTISGEHGDGLSRTAYLPGQYGPLYEVFRRIKRLADPRGILNPGKIVGDDPDLVNKNLRFGADYRLVLPAKEQPFYDLARDLEKCSGCGLCRSTQAATRMCPVFRALGLETAAARAKANILRDILAGRTDRSALDEPAFRGVLDLCLNCGSCALDCPSAVDLSSVVMEARAQFTVPGLSDRFFGSVDQVSRLGSAIPWLANRLARLPGSRWLMEKTLGFSARAPLPALGFGSLAAGLGAQVGPRGKVVLFTDVYPDYYQHGLGRSLVRLLNRLGWRVEIPGLNYAGYPLLVNGRISRARQVAQENLRELEALAHKGYPILFSEPSAFLCVTGEYGKLVDPARLEKIRPYCFELTDWLARQPELPGTGTRETKKVFYHQPCHMRSLGLRPAPDLLRRVPGLKVDAADAGCCGMGGTFGLKAKNRGLSEKIGRPLRDHLRKGGYDCVVTECSSCRMQIGQISGLPVLHPAEVLDGTLEN